MAFWPRLRMKIAYFHGNGGLFAEILSAFREIPKVLGWNPSLSGINLRRTGHLSPWPDGFNRGVNLACYGASGIIHEPVIWGGCVLWTGDRNFEVS